MNNNNTTATVENITATVSTKAERAALRKAMAEHTATLNAQDATLDGFLNEMEATIAGCNEPCVYAIAPEEIVTPEMFATARQNMLALMSETHNAIAPHINAARQSAYNAFFRPEDKFIPESGCNNFGTMFANI